MGIHQIIDLSGHEHSFKLLPNHRTSVRGIALVLCAVIGLLYSFNL